MKVILSKLALILILMIAVIACKKQQSEIILKPDECKPKDPVTYFEVDRMDVFTIGIHVPSSRIRIGFSDTSQYAKQLKNYYPELRHELSTYTFCPCNLPDQFQKEGKKFRISGISRIENSSQILSESGRKSHKSTPRF